MIPLLCATIVTALAAPQAVELPPVPHLPSPLIADARAAAPSGSLVVHVDAGKLAAIAATAEGGVIVDDIPLSKSQLVSLSLVRQHPLKDATVVVASHDRDGSLVETPLADLPGAEGVILTGSMIGAPGSRAIISFGPAGVFGVVELGTSRLVLSSGPHRGSQPILVFNPLEVSADLLTSHPWTCETDTSGAANEGGIADAPPPCRQYHAAYESDREYALLFGGDLVAAANYAALLNTATSQIYANDINSHVGLVYLRLWADANDPWVAIDMPTELTEFLTVWTATQGGVVRDMAQFLSGRPLGGGIAYLNSMCGTSAYSVCAYLNGTFPYPLVSNNFGNWDIYVVSHEMAHNLGSIHTHEHGWDSPDFCGLADCTAAAFGTIMSYCYICPPGMTNIALTLAQVSKTDINTFMAGAPCTFTPTTSAAVAVDDFAVCTAGSSVLVNPIANDLPANCLPVAISAIDGGSAHGGSIAAEGSQFRYFAPTGFLGSDSFNYTITGSGSPSTGQVFITVKGPPADIDGDGHVNGADLGYLIGHWGSNDPAADLNADGTVNGADLGILIGAWTG